MSSVSITTTFGRFCWAFFRRSARCLFLCPSLAAWQLSSQVAEAPARGEAFASDAPDGAEASAPESAQATTAAASTATQNATLSDRSELIRM